MFPLLLVLSVIAAVIGVVGLSPATAGVGVMCGACLLGIWARIAQAQEQFNAFKAARKAGDLFNSGWENAPATPQKD